MKNKLYWFAPILLSLLGFFQNLGKSAIISTGIFFVLLFSICLFYIIANLKLTSNKGLLGYAGISLILAVIGTVSGLVFAYLAILFGSNTSDMAGLSLIVYPSIVFISGIVLSLILLVIRIPIMESKRNFHKIIISSIIITLVIFLILYVPHLFIDYIDRRIFSESFVPVFVVSLSIILFLNYLLAYIYNRLKK